MRDQSYKAVLVTLIALIAVLFWLTTPPRPKSEGTTDRATASTNKKNRYETMRQQKIRVKPSPFSQSKVAVVQKNILIDQSLNQAMPSTNFAITQGTEMIALIDNDCAKNSSVHSTFAKVNSGTMLGANLGSGLKIQAHKFILQRDTDIDSLSAQADQDPCIIGVTENGPVAADSFYHDPRSDEQKHIENVKVALAESFFFQSSLRNLRKVIIAIVDSGIDYAHSDLKDNMWTNSAGNHGFDFFNDDNDPMDDNKHGTHVAGLAAAIGGNNFGGSGVMPENVQLMAVKVLDNKGSGSFAEVANGVRYAVDNGAHIVNLSLNGPGENKALADALVYAINKGVVVVVSAGNDNIEINSSDKFRTPASLGKVYSGVITVGSIDATTSNRSSFSNHGKEFVEIGSPGSNGILSTILDNSFSTLSGTSMASPIVTGALALVIGALRESNIPYTAGEVEDLMKKSGHVNESLKDFFQSGRQLDVLSLKNHLLYRYIAPLNGGIEDGF